MKQGLKGVTLIALVSLTLFSVFNVSAGNSSECERTQVQANRDLARINAIIGQLIEHGAPDHVIQHFIDMYHQHRGEWSFKIGAACN